jgi:hypothetical protein
MVFGKKPPDRFDAFGPKKGGGPEDKSRDPKPSSKPLDLKPPVPTPGNVKRPPPPSGAAPKPVVPKLQEAKPLPRSGTPSAKTPEPKAAETKPPASKAPEVKAPDVRPVTPTAPATPASTPSGGRPVPVPGVTRPTSAPGPVPGGVRPASSAPAASARLRSAETAAPGAPKPAGPAAPPADGLGALKASKDVHVVEFGKKREVVLGLSYQALITAVVIAFAAIVIIVLIAVALFRGGGSDTKTGEGDRGKNTVGGGDEGGKVAPASPGFPAGMYWTVKVLTVRNEPARRTELGEVIRFLSGKMDVQPLVTYESKTREWLTLFAGAFLKDKKADADAMAARLRVMVFRDRKEFRDATPWQIP